MYRTLINTCEKKDEKKVDKELQTSCVFKLIVMPPTLVLRISLSDFSLK